MKLFSLIACVFGKESLVLIYRLYINKYINIIYILILQLLFGNDKYFKSATDIRLWLDLFNFLRVKLLKPSLSPDARTFTLFALQFLPTRFTLYSIYFGTKLSSEVFKVKEELDLILKYFIAACDK